MGPSSSLPSLQLALSKEGTNAYQSSPFLALQSFFIQFATREKQTEKQTEENSKEVGKLKTGMGSINTINSYQLHKSWWEPMSLYLHSKTPTQY